MSGIDIFSKFFHPEAIRSGHYQARANTPAEFHEVLDLLVLCAKALDAMLEQNERMERKMAEIDDRLDSILSDVTAEGTQLDSMGALIAGLRQQVADALAQSGATADQQNKVNEIFALAESNKQKIMTAMSTTTGAVAPQPDPTNGSAGSPTDDRANAPDGTVSQVPGSGQVSPTATQKTTDPTTPLSTTIGGSNPTQAQIDQGAPLAPGSTGSATDVSTGGGTSTGNGLSNTIPASALTPAETPKVDPSNSDDTTTGQSTPTTPPSASNKNSMDP